MGKGLKLNALCSAGESARIEGSRDAEEFVRGHRSEEGSIKSALGHAHVQPIGPGR
jgi:hypothetical protein